MTTTTTSLTIAEEALVTTLGNIAAARAGAHASELGHAPPTDAEAGDMARAQIRALVGYVIGLRDAEAAPTEGQIAELVEGLAQGAVARVLGRPPAMRGDAN